MTQFIKTLLISSLSANTDSVLPPANYTKASGSGGARTLGNDWFWSNSFDNVGMAVWWDNTILLGDGIKATTRIGTLTGSNISTMGACLVNSSGDGYMFTARETNNDVRIFTLTTGGVLGSLVHTITGYTPVTGHRLSMISNPSTGAVSIFNENTGVQLGTTYSGSVGNNYRYGGMVSRQGRLTELRVEYTLPYAVVSVDGDDSIEIGDTSFPIITEGLTAQPVATTDNGNIVITITGGSNNNWTASINNRTEGGALPVLPATVLLTLTNGSEVATKSITITKQNVESVQTFISPDTTNRKFLGYWFNQSGHVVDGAKFYYIPTGDSNITSSGAIITTNSGSITGWLYPVSGTTANKTYAFTAVINEFGVPIVIDLQHLVDNGESPKFDSMYLLGDRP